MGLFSFLTYWGVHHNRNGKGEKKMRWRVFSLKELQSATSDFDHNNKLGQGASGEVFWGKLSNGSQIAVKKPGFWSNKADLKFAVEVEILGRIRHKNVMSLLGYCAEGQEHIIVYDYMPNACLRSHLHGRHLDHGLLNWGRRMNIAIGAAEGIAYLHHNARPRIIHRDIKASNVLLDSNFEARIGGFEYAKLIPDGEAHVIACIEGASSHLAPEYVMSGKVKESCDVYSFGILLLELASGKKSLVVVGDGTMTIMEWALPLVKEKKFEEIADLKLNGQYVEEEMKSVVAVGLACAQSDADKRPTMMEVVELLKGEMKDNVDKIVDFVV